MHVPNENLPRYRALRRISNQFNSIGDSLSNIGEYADANKAWRESSRFNAKAQELRVSGKKDILNGTHAQHGNEETPSRTGTSVPGGREAHDGHDVLRIPQ